MREEENKNPRKSKTNQFFKKRWVFPAIYLASAAIILTAVLWYQNSTTNLADQPKPDNEIGTTIDGGDAVTVTENVEEFSMPVVDPNSVEIQKQFYDDNASEEDQAAALVFYNNTYTENTGIDIVSKDKETFDVVASLSGTVTRVVKDPLLGFVVELDHGNDITTLYSSLENVKVEEGAKVAQGELLATAGRSLYNEEAGIHTHFEIRKDDTPVNPLDFFEKGLASLEETNQEETQQTSADKEAADKEDGKATEEESDKDKAADEEKPEQGEGESEENITDTPDASIGQAKA